MRKNTVKTTLRTLLLTLLLLGAIAIFMLLPGCGKRKGKVYYPDENTVVIEVGEDVEKGQTLLSYMNKLKDGGKLDFTVSDGMITSVNGLSNAADYSSCWMLYTSDKQNANDAWGTFAYQNGEYGSAILGAEKLKIKSGCLYIWAYITF